jgi:hypothetical protein
MAALEISTEIFTTVEKSSGFAGGPPKSEGIIARWKVDFKRFIKKGSSTTLFFPVLRPPLCFGMAFLGSPLDGYSFY